MTLPEDTILEHRYRIDGLLAHGGMGAIYRGFDTNLSMPVAIKENFIQTPPQVAQFKQEALILARLRHPALPRVIHHFSFEGQQYLVMDFIEGENLWEIIRRRGEPLGEREALEILMQVCQAVNYLHRQKPAIIHRDIKPQNIKITPDGRAMLVDFGIAKQLTGLNDATQAGAQGITPGFSPPEQYSGQGTGPASDIYALGATLYAALTGKKPPNSISLAAGRVKFEPPNLVNPKLSQATGHVILQAMQAKPHLRPQPVTEWQRQLETILVQLPAAPLSKEDTLASASRPSTQKDAAPAKAAAPDGAARAETGFWLVDSRGIGYPLSVQPVSLGRGSDVEVPINETNVSRRHALVRVEANRCYVQDQNSANGTFLNGYRLGSDWYPLASGDGLVIGSARFFLTTTRPARLAAPKPLPVDLPAAAPASTDQMTFVQPANLPPVAAPLKPKNSAGTMVGIVVVVALLVLAMAAAVGGYFWRNPAQLAAWWGNSSPMVAVSGSGTPAAVIIDKTPSATVPPPTAPSPTVTSAPTETPSPRPSPPNTRVATLAPAQKMATAVPMTTTIAGPTPSLTPGAAVNPTRVQAKAGPTVIPLQFSVSVPRLGSREVVDVDLNPLNPIEVYAVVKRDGIYKSVNGGDGPWARIDLDGSSLTGLTIDSNDPTRLYAPTWNAVLKSTDGGNTWEVKTNGLMANRAVDVVVVHPANSAVLFAGVGENMVGSVDGGETWNAQLYGNGLGVVRLNQIVVDPFNQKIVYVAGVAAAIYKSENGGQNFYPLPYNLGEGSYGLAAHPTRQNVLLAGINAGQAAMVKTENGVDFRSVSGGLIYGGADSAYCAVVYAPGNPDIVYIGSGFESDPDAKGIFKSIDGGESWQNISSGLATNPNTGYPYYVKSIVVHPADPNLAFAATGSGLYKTTNGGQSWTLQ
jgi:serine/threonine protein kinase/photosystem II stability/assembly factor-like uncharacterized protein